MLTMHKDGINAVDLGVIGDSQYALSYVQRLKADVFRRKASEVGTYGGWRWECGSLHPSQYPTLPDMGELAQRIDAAGPGPWENR